MKIYKTEMYLIKQAQLAEVLKIFLTIFAIEETVQQQTATQARILQVLAATIPEMAVGEDKKLGEHTLV